MNPLYYFRGCAFKIKLTSSVIFFYCYIFVLLRFIEMHLTPSRVYTMELFLRIKCVTYFHEKASLLIFDWLLIAHQINELVSMTETSVMKELNTSHIYLFLITLRNKPILQGKSMKNAWIWTVSAENFQRTCWYSFNILFNCKYYLMERRKQEEKKRKFPPYAICISYLSRSSRQRCSIRKGIFKSRRKNSQENTCARVSFLIKLQVQGWQLY